MNKELRAKLEKLETAKQEARTLVFEDRTAEAKEKMAEVRSLQDAIDTLRALDEMGTGYTGGEQRQAAGGSGAATERSDDELAKEYRHVFLKGLRRHSITSEDRSIITEYEKRAVMNEGLANPAIPDGDVSLLVPKDAQTRINEIIRSYNDLSRIVTVENVTALSGTRVLEKDEAMVPFALIDEYDELPEIDNPKFVPLSFQVKKRGGHLPITNDLLKDTDQNLMAYVTRWIGKKAVITRNKLISDLLLTWTPQAIANFTALKKILNVTLDPAISARASIVTNQDGFDWLDSQKDADGRFLLQEDITRPGGKMLFGRKVEVIANRTVPSIAGTPNKAPIWIGDAKEAIVLFSREFYELASTKEGGNAWRRDTTELRAIMRDDIKKWDDTHIVYGQLSLS